MPERVIDALLVRHTDVVQEDAQQSGALMLDVCVAQIAIHLTTPAISGDPLSALNFRARGMTCSVQKTPASGDTSAGFDLALFARAISLVATPLSVGRPDISLKDVGNPNSNELSDTAVASANVDGIRLGFLNSDQRSQLQGTVGLIDVQVVTTAVGLFLSMAQIWTQAIDSAHEAVQTDSSSASLLYRILKGTIATSTTSDQPSFVYESAYSLHVEDQRNIRRDPGWMMLARLRHWLRQGVPVIITDDVPMPDVAEFVVSQLAKLDDAAGGNADLVRQQEFVKSAFGNEIEQPVVEGTSSANRSRGLFVTVDSLMMRHFGRLFESGEIAPSTLRVLSASIGLRRSANIRDDRPLQQLRVVTTVRSVEVEIQSGAFSAVQSTLKSLEKHTSSPPSSKSIQPSQDELASVVVIDGHLLSASLSVLASGVRLRFGVSGTHASLSHRETRKINGDDRLVSARSGVTVCSELIELALLQPLDEHDLITHSVDRVVISTKADGFRMVADSNGSTRRSASPHVRLLVGLNSLEFDSRPQLRAFYLFARDWRERHYR